VSAGELSGCSNRSTCVSSGRTCLRVPETRPTSVTCSIAGWLWLGVIVDRGARTTLLIFRQPCPGSDHGTDAPTSKPSLPRVHRPGAQPLPGGLTAS
jgi:hypothetical protein